MGYGLMIEYLASIFLAGLATLLQNTAAADRTLVCPTTFPAYVKLPAPAISNELIISEAGTWHWNGSVVTEDEVSRFVKFIHGMKPRPQMVIGWQAGADCAAISRAQKIFLDSGLCADTMCFSTGIVAKIPEPPAAPPAPPAALTPPNPLLSPASAKIADAIRDESIPASGQSLTVEGELIRAVDKLRYEAQGNGNGNRDHGHQMLIDYLEATLDDRAVFTDTERKQTKTILDRLRPDYQVELSDAAYDFLIVRAVRYYQVKGSQPRAINPKLVR
jgi:hypothetical protein